ncbi:MAG: hypothetical protein C4617_05240 [Candidatus Liberibacter europaeus]|uniref:Uncharacterized protein n=1 Tax=Candidatus Liberibacter europaeus TaxID=744859 RepID=A0A2T4VWF1_9HYPH|nr:hypothetical protein [Candidatus Liberibacter europaeus]PTL86114.1 MAG: hypothetical protein C4617_05240 [Candidatus Liberibacter europaeus]
MSKIELCKMYAFNILKSSSMLGVLMLFPITTLAKEQISNTDENRIIHALSVDSDTVIGYLEEGTKPEKNDNISINYSIKKPLKTLYVKGDFIVGFNVCDQNKELTFPYIGSDIAIGQKSNLFLNNDYYFKELGIISEASIGIKNKSLATLFNVGLDLNFYTKITPSISLGIEQSLKFPIYGIGGAKVETFILSDIHSYLNGCSLLVNSLVSVDDEFFPIIPIPRLSFIYHRPTGDSKILIGFRKLSNDDNTIMLSLSLSYSYKF